MSSLSAIILIPLFVGVALLVTGFGTNSRSKALIAGLFVAWQSSKLWCSFQLDSASMQFREFRPLFGSVGFSWNLGVDGWTLLLLLAAVSIMCTAILLSDDDKAATPAWILVLSGSLIGTILSLNLALTLLFVLLFYVGVALLQSELADQPVGKQFVRSWLGAAVPGLILLLVGIVLFAGSSGGSGSLNYESILRLDLTFSEQQKFMVLFVVIFAALGGLFPFSGWRKHAARSLSPAIAIIVFGGTSLISVWGFVRFVIPLFRDVSAIAAPTMVHIAFVWTLLAAAAAWVGDDLRTQLGHLSAAASGLSIAALFLLETRAGIGSSMFIASYVLALSAAWILCAWYERISGVHPDWWVVKSYSHVSPSLRTFTLFVAAALSALPLTGPFSGEFLILIEAARQAISQFQISGELSGITHLFLFALPVLTGMSIASYYLWTIGSETRGETDYNTAPRFREAAGLILLLSLLFYWGIRPQTFSDRVSASIKYTYERQLAQHTPVKAPIVDSGKID